jgi:type I restriction enzyme S subunit
MESIANYGARSDRMNISTNDFYNMPIPFPCIIEQTKIANFLSAIDDKINRTQKQIEKAEVWKKGLLQQMFV